MNKDLYEELRAFGRATTGIRAIMLYGSVARNDADEFSDFDLLVATDAQNPEVVQELKRSIVGKLKAQGIKGVSLAFYALKDLQRMARQGSMFICHLAVEGEVIYERGGALFFLKRKIAYKNISRDLTIYAKMCRSIKKNIQAAEKKLEVFFELSTLSAVARNACIAFTAHLGVPIFSRCGAFEYCRKMFSSEIKMSRADYENLYGFRKAYEGRCEYPSRARQPIFFLDEVQKIIKTFQRNVYVRRKNTN
ncbi:nucleotidyltransferase domain-containing protein [bacterium]|nr:nucleotidyltransferase domain-containing protein [bacterium]